MIRNSVGLAIIACLLFWVLPLQAQEEPRISALSALDRQFMQQQRDLMSEIAASRYGRQFNGIRGNDLDLLQRILDDRLVQPEQTRELQAMGVIMGDLLAEELGLDWVIYEDSVGRSRALRYRDTDNYLFPMTMISRRREVDNRTPVDDIYRKAQEAMRAVIPPLPFQ